MVFSHHRLISSSVADLRSVPGLASLIVEQNHRRELRRYSFSCLASLGLMKTIILSGSVPFDTFHNTLAPRLLDSPLTAYNLINSPSPRFCFDSLRFVLLGGHGGVMKRACCGIVAARRLV